MGDAREGGARGAGVVFDVWEGGAGEEGQELGDVEDELGGRGGGAGLDGQRVGVAGGEGFLGVGGQVVVEVGV